MRTALCFSLLLLYAVQVQAGAIYKWTDAEGRVHYGDRPGQSEASQVRVPATPPPSAPEVDHASQQDKLLKAMQQDREQRKLEAEQRRLERQQREQNCRRAQNEYNAYRDARGVYRRDKDGERQYLSFEEREALQQQKLKEVQRWCR